VRLAKAARYGALLDCESLIYARGLCAVRVLAPHASPLTNETPRQTSTSTPLRVTARPIPHNTRGSSRPRDVT
jgi:hypothetical protein